MSSTESTPVVTYIGGSMYGDGEYVLEFHGAGSMLAPMTATVIGPGALRSLTFAEGVTPSVDVARRAIAIARAS